MTQNEIQTALNDLIQLEEGGRALEAFDKYYHEDFVGQENQSEARLGKVANRKYEVDFLNNITHIRTYKATGTLVGSNVSAITWELDLDHKEWGHMLMTEINLQVWQEGQIIRESYHYNP